MREAKGILAWARGGQVPALMLGGLVMLGSLYGLGARARDGARIEGQTASAEGTRRALVIAHRGGAGLWPENTLHAFEQATALGADVIELDVHAAADGELVVIHDATVGRTTEGAGSVKSLPLAALKSLDAGHRWTADGGKTFPFRGRGLTVPTLREVFERLPRARFNIEPKQESPSITRALCRLIREHKMGERVVVGSFRQPVLEEFRRECPEVATSAGPTELAEFLGALRAGGAAAGRPRMRALQVPDYAGGTPLVTAEFVRAAHAQGLEVHAWTVNEVADMRRLLDAGVDGIMTDYPDRLLGVLGGKRAP
jgi:glycerophosphoryl diester phosphodiesterase